MIEMKTGGMLSEVIKERRKALALTQEDVANLAGCARLFVHELEKGKITIRFEKLIAVLHVLGLQLAIESGSSGLVDKTHETN